MYTVTRSHHVHNRKGERVDTLTKTTECATLEEATANVKNLEWLNENRTEAGKYFNIKIEVRNP